MLTANYNTKIKPLHDVWPQQRGMNIYPMNEPHAGPTFYQ
jgi:hypothetical protein